MYWILVLILMYVTTGFYSVGINPALATGNVQNPTCQDSVVGLSAAEQLKMTEIKLYNIPKQIIRIELEKDVQKVVKMISMFKIQRHLF